MVIKFFVDDRLFMVDSEDIPGSFKPELGDFIILTDPETKNKIKTRLKRRVWDTDGVQYVLEYHCQFLQDGE